MGEIICVCGQPFILRESYEAHLPVCPGQKDETQEPQYISFEKKVFDRFMANLKTILGRLIAEERCCPACQHRFVPADDLSKEASDAWMGMFGPGSDAPQDKEEG